MCVRKKTSYVKKQGILRPLPIPMQKWRDISIDFVVNLPSNNKFTNIIVVINRLMKIQYMIPIDSINAILVAECFVKHVFKLHRFSNLIISDHKNQFISDF